MRWSAVHLSTVQVCQEGSAQPPSSGGCTGYALRRSDQSKDLRLLVVVRGAFSYGGLTARLSTPKADRSCERRGECNSCPFRRVRRKTGTRAQKPGPGCATIRRKLHWSDRGLIKEECVDLNAFLGGAALSSKLPHIISLLPILRVWRPKTAFSCNLGRRPYKIRL